MAAPELWDQPRIAKELGFGVHAVKKWRGAYLRAVAARKPLPKGALPKPTLDQPGKPLWAPEVILAWAERTGRRNPETKATEWPSPPGRPTDEDRARRADVAPSLAA